MVLVVEREVTELRCRTSKSKTISETIPYLLEDDAALICLSRNESVTENRFMRVDSMMDFVRTLRLGSEMITTLLRYRRRGSPRRDSTFDRVGRKNEVEKKENKKRRCHWNVIFQLPPAGCKSSKTAKYSNLFGKFSVYNIPYQPCQHLFWNSGLYD